MINEFRTVASALEDIGKAELASDLRIIAKPKGITLPDSIYALLKFGRDTNGNSVVKLMHEGTGKTFTIQSGGNLPNAHRLRGHKIKDIDADDLKKIAVEVQTYIKKFGTAKMK